MIRPQGLSIALTLDVLDEPLITLVIPVEAVEPLEILFSEAEVDAAVGLILEGRVRAAVLREMLTMFPEQRDAILANVVFRWTGEVEDGPPT
jgi:hypothetical protein